MSFSQSNFENRALSKARVKLVAPPPDHVGVGLAHVHRDLVELRDVRLHLGLYCTQPALVIGHDKD